MTNYNLDQVKLFYWQILLSLGLIISIFISISLSYNEILKMENKKPLYDTELETKILIFNRSFAALIATGHLLIDVIDKKENNSEFSSLQIDASILSLISSLIVLYIALNSINNLSETTFENPNV